MKNRILNEFLHSNLKIKSLKKLEEYVIFCLENNVKKKVKYETAYHHVLPKAKGLPFLKYADLSVHDWNGVYLKHGDHYNAHYLLTEAIDNYSILFAFYKMNNVNLAKGLINEKDLIEKEKFEKIAIDIAKNNAKLKKERYTKDSISIKKMIDTRKKEFIDEKGNITTIDKLARKKQVLTKERKSRLFNIYHIERGLVKSNVLRKEIVKISQGLLKSTKEKYLGFSKNARYNLINNSNESLIGLYVEEIK